MLFNKRVSFSSSLHTHHQKKQSRKQSMRFISSTKKHNTSSSMGFLLVFFPDEHNNKVTNPIVDKTTAAVAPGDFTSPSSSSSPARTIRRTNSNLLFSKAQSTISICVLLVFLTVLLFTLSTFEPTIPTTSSISAVGTGTRRFLSEKSLINKPNSNWASKLGLLKLNTMSHGKKNGNPDSSFALQGMGTLFRRGTRAMNDLVVAHVADEVTVDELRLFLRLLHRSGVTAKSDVVFIFSSSSSRFSAVFEEENDSFQKLLTLNSTRDSVFGFDLTQFVKSEKREVGEPLWGRKNRTNFTDSGDSPESSRLIYGSVLGFETNELDPENSLSGFLDHVPMSLRRWACYPMLLGRVRRNFKHILLVDTKSSLVIGDPFGRIRTRSPESVYLLTKTQEGRNKHKGNSEKTQCSNYPVNSAILMGGARGIRRLSNAMLTEIVRAAMQHKKKNSIAESGILSQLVGNVHVLKDVSVTVSAESVPDASSLTGWKSDSGGGHSVIQRGNSNVNSIIRKQICSCEDSSVYRDC